MHLAIEWVPAERPAPQLLLLLHDRGAGGASMRPLALALCDAFPCAAVLAPDAPHGVADGPDAAAGGRCWFPSDDSAGVADRGAPAPPTEGLDAALDALQAWVQAQQDRLGITRPSTALVGFGQGAALALALSLRADGLAGRVLAFGGAFVRLPSVAPQLTTLHLLHGGADPVVPASHMRHALTQLGVLHGDATLDVAEGVGHELHPALIHSALFRLRSHIPHRTWRAALGAATQL